MKVEMLFTQWFIKLSLYVIDRYIIDIFLLV